jgi:hypothetical protein
LSKKPLLGSSPFKNKFIIKDKVYAGGDPYANGYVQEVEEPPFFKHSEKNHSCDNTRQKH